MTRGILHSSRRSFLKGVGSASFASSLGIWNSQLLQGCSSDARGADWAQIERLLPGKVLRPNASDFEALSAPWNLRLTEQRPRPQGIVRCESASDVQIALDWGIAQSLPLVARSGGHSYSGYSTTSGLIIDLSKMMQVNYDPATQTATVAGGVRNANLYEAFPALGRTITHGRCRGVGVAGLVTGGGIGFNMRRFGVTSDQLLETQIVTAQGDVLTCNESENSDLFWAARGAGGGNFGIHTSFKFKTFEAGEVIAFKLVWTSSLESVLVKLFEILRTAPNDLGCKLSVEAAGTTGDLSVQVLGQWAGSQSSFESFFAPANNIVEANASRGFVKPNPYWTAQNDLSDEGLPEHMYERSRYVTDALGVDAARVILQKMQAWPKTEAGARWKGFLTGGVIRDVSASATSFVHRSDWLLSGVELNWKGTEAAAKIAENLDWTDDLYEAMKPFCSSECYQNFIDESETNYLRAYHGTNLERLVEVKRTHDPANIFQFAQSIPTRL